MQRENLVEHGLMSLDKRVSIWGEITSLSEGRDKIFKIFSGLLKVARWVLANYFTQWAFSKELQTRLKNAGTATSTARAFLKLFTDWVFFRLAIRVWKKQHFGWLKVLTMGRLLGLAFYFSFNIPIWLQTTKLVPSIDKDFWNKASLICYIISTTCQFCMDFKQLYDMTKEIADLELFSSSSSAAPSGPRPTLFGIDVRALIAGLLNPSKRSKTEEAKVDSYNLVLTSKKNPVTHSAHQVALRRYLSAYVTETVPETNAEASQVPATESKSAQRQSISQDEYDEFEDGASNDNGDSPDSQTEALRVFVPLKRPSQNSLSTGYRAALQDFESASTKALDKEDTLRRNRVQLLINFLKDGCDYAGAFNGVFDWGWSDLTNGLIGINSAGISLWRLWQRHSANATKKIREKQLAKRRAQQIEAEQRALAALQEA